MGMKIEITERGRRGKKPLACSPVRSLSIRHWRGLFGVNEGRNIRMDPLKTDSYFFLPSSYTTLPKQDHSQMTSPA